jgi:hypothetical protein
MKSLALRHIPLSIGKLVNTLRGAEGTKRRLQVGISQVGNFAGWNFAG